jgi:hypothetical protein
VLVGIFPHTPGHDVPGIDVVTGKSIRGSFRYFFEPRSPDGKLLADTRQHGAGFDVRVSPLAGGRARVYGRVPGCRNEESFGSGIDSLQFVPGRRSLVYQSECYLPFASLYAIEPNGTGLRRLTHDSGDAVGPKWSPDGTRILYAQFDGNPTECKGCSGQTWIVNADGSELVAQRQALPLRRDEHQRAAEALRLPRRGRHAARPAHPRRCPRLGAVADRLRRHLGLALDGEARRNRPQEGGRARRGAGVVA